MESDASIHSSILFVLLIFFLEFIFIILNTKKIAKKNENECSDLMIFFLCFMSARALDEEMSKEPHI